MASAGPAPERQPLEQRVEGAGAGPEGGVPRAQREAQHPLRQPQRRLHAPRLAPRVQHQVEGHRVGAHPLSLHLRQHLLLPGCPPTRTPSSSTLYTSSRAGALSLYSFTTSCRISLRT